MSHISRSCNDILYSWAHSLFPPSIISNIAHSVKRKYPLVFCRSHDSFTFFLDIFTMSHHNKFSGQLYKTHLLWMTFLTGSICPHMSQQHCDESQVSINYITLLLFAYPSYPPIPLTPLHYSTSFGCDNLELWDVKKTGRLLTEFIMAK